LIGEKDAQSIAEYLNDKMAKIIKDLNHWFSDIIHYFDKPHYEPSKHYLRGKSTKDSDYRDKH